MINEKKDVENYYDTSNNWRNKLYIDHSQPFNRLLIRRKEYSFQMIDGIKHLKKGTALDVGCGPGAYIEELMKRGFEVYGIDLSQEMLNTCKIRLSIDNQNFKKNFQIADIESIPFDDNKFNIVICSGVLGLLLSDEQAISELYRVLMPGGILLLTVENMMSFSHIDYVIRNRIFRLFNSNASGFSGEDGKLTLRLKWMSENAGLFYKIYNPWKLNVLLAEKGFKLVNSLTAGHEFRILRRTNLVPEKILSSVEVVLEKLSRRFRIPYFRYAGQFYTALYNKL